MRCMHWLTGLLRPHGRSLRARVVVALTAAALAPSAWAHKASDAYLRVADVPASLGTAGAGASIGLVLSVALKDVDAALEQLDADGDRQLTWGEVRQSMPAIVQWVGQGMLWQCDGTATVPAWRFEALEQRTDGRYARLAATLPCAPAQAITLRYGLMQGIDPTHRLLVGGALSGQTLAAVLAPDGRSGTDLRSAGSRAGQAGADGAEGAQGADATEPGAPRGGLATLLHFVTEGVHHILSGYDHLAFLLALLLPISLARPQSRRHRDLPSHTESGTTPTAETPPSGASDRLAGIKALLITVTCFTVGHSITLALAGLGWVTVSGNWVEPAIAISIGISALLNLFPVNGLRGSWLALGFGLVHGLGFSGVLVEAGVSGASLLWALAGFNLGVEMGQLLVVALWCAVSVVLARWAWYRSVVVRGGSIALLVLSLYWTVQRLAFAG